MIIDSHVHLVNEGWVHRDFLIGSMRMAAAMLGKDAGLQLDPEVLADASIPLLYDPDGEKLISGMDSAGVDVSCVFALDYGLLTGDPGVDIEEQNRLVSETARRFPGRLIPFFSIDPRRENAAELFSRAVEEWGMRGLKLHPTSGFFPYDERCYPLYEKCMEYGVPVVIHTGSQPAPLKFRFAQPIGVDDVAADFPGLPIIMAHVAHQMWEEALLVASVKPNIHFDFSGWQVIYNQHPEDFYRMLRRVLDTVGPWRVFFGTDGPYVNALCPLETWKKAVTEPDLSRCPEISFREREIELIMGNSFARLAGLEK